ncbi:hypothetical protein [Streptomyces sp. NPDC054863]
MFSLLRRRPAAPCSASTSRPAPGEEALVWADAAVLERADRIRAAWTTAGMDTGLLGPAPAWLDTARTGTPVPLGPDDQTMLAAYLGTPWMSVASQAGCEAALREVEALGLWRELRAEGVTAIPCEKTRKSPEQMRALLENARASRPCPS